MEELPKQEDILNYDLESSKGCFLEVDAHIPEHLHNELNDLPIFPEKIDIHESMISERSRVLRESKLGDVGTFCSEKLAPNLLEKRSYKCHIAALKLYCELGGVVTKVHRGVSFNQSRWLAPYIEVIL